MDRKALVVAALAAAAAVLATVHRRRRRKLEGCDPAVVLEEREKHFASNLSVSYRPDCLVILRGDGAYLFDQDGRAYLDCVNNVAHVGHSHPKVVEAGCQQLRQLNTNTRYLHPARVSYARRLLATFEPHLDVLFLTCSGSEANDLALRLARAHTGGKDVIVQGAAYHGHTAATIECSPYKFEGRGGTPQKPHIHKVPAPDIYNGPFRVSVNGTATPSALGCAYAQLVAQKCHEVVRNGGTLAAMVAESVLGCAGQVVPPPGYLKEAFEAVRSSGGVCIADEVQVGFGRCGTSFWAYQSQGATPDIVTMGKPMGNGYPIAGVVTTRAIADSFARGGVEYFNTFGGSTAACVIGEAVLDVIQDERLQENAAMVGNYLMSALRSLADRQMAIGDVRGVGLFIGIELVLDRETREAAGALAEDVALRCRHAGVLISTDGPRQNVIKLKPPMCITTADADKIVAALDAALSAAASAAADSGPRGIPAQ